MNPYQNDIFYLKEGNCNSEHSINDDKILVLKQKKEELKKIRITTRIFNPTKNKFLDDCIKRQQIESVVIRSIVDLHYAITEAVPECRSMGFSDLKKFLLNKLI